MNRRAFLRGFTLATSGLFVPRIVRAVPPPLLDRTWRRKASNDFLNVGLIGAWTLAAGNGLTDWSGHGNNGTGQGTGFTLGGVANHLGQAGRATVLTASSNQYATVADATILRLTGPKSISIWVYINGNQSGVYAPMIVSKSGATYYPTFAIQLLQDAGYGANRYAFDFVFGSGTSNNDLISTALYTSYLGVWTFLAATYNGNVQSLYINAVLNKSATIGSVTSNASAYSLDIGNDAYASTAYFNGSLSDLRLYNCAIPTSTIQSIMLAKLLKDHDFAREFWAQNPDHFLRPIWEERMAA